MLTKNYIVNRFYLHPWVLRLAILLLKPFSFHPPINWYLRKKETQFGFYKILKPGDTVVQAGAAMRVFKSSNQWYDHSSHVWRIAQRIGDKGRIIVIEPDARNCEKLRAIAQASPYGCELIIVQKAIFKREDNTRFHIGKRTSNSQVENVQDKENTLLKDEVYTGETVDVKQDSLDNILADVGVNPEEVDYVNLTVNGSEYDALLGMTTLLKSKTDLAITVIAGREFLYEGVDHIGLIDGQPDHEVIISLLQQHGFSATLKRFQDKGYGYVVAHRGNKLAFM